MDKRDERIELFETAPVLKAVMKMSIPTVLASLVMVIYNLADTFFVGMLNDPIQNSAVTLAAPVLLAFNAVNNLFGVGTSSLMSRMLGEKRYDYVKRTSSFGFWCALLSSVLFSVVCFVFRRPLMNILGADSTTYDATMSYMKYTVFLGAAPAIINVVFGYMIRAEGSAFHASIGTMSGCLLNIILDPFFILPQYLNMGAAGAGLATLIANCYSCLYFLVMLYVKRNSMFMSISPSKLGFDRSIAGGIAAVGIPAAIQNLLNVTGMTILNNFAASYGSTVVAAMGISYKIYVIPTYAAMGYSQGSMPIVGYNYASGNIKRMKETINVQIVSVLIAMVSLAVCYYVFAGRFISLFMENSEVVSYGTAFLRAMCLGIPFITMDFLGVGVFQACGKGSRALLFAVMRKIVLEIPFIFVLNSLLPIYGLGYSQCCTEVVMMFIVQIMLHRFVKKCADSTI